MYIYTSASSNKKTEGSPLWWLQTSLKVGSDYKDMGITCCACDPILEHDGIRMKRPYDPSFLAFSLDSAIVQSRPYQPAFVQHFTTRRSREAGRPHETGASRSCDILGLRADV